MPDASITATNLADGSVTNSKLTTGSVSLSKLASDVIPGLNSRLSVFNVKDYGAVGNGTTDDTTAFQNALNAASSAGGGIVWVPTGGYKIATHLTIPTNVTLEGVHAAAPREATSGSRLLACESPGNENGTPFITMNKESTLKGIIVSYPNQSSTTPVAYPWCVRGSGDNCFNGIGSKCTVANNQQ